MVQVYIYILISERFGVVRAPPTCMHVPNACRVVNHETAMVNSIRLSFYTVEFRLPIPQHQNNRDPSTRFPKSLAYIIDRKRVWE